ncbi:MAG: NAD-dependent epimerase/dehydratase family protein [Sediminibacterium sp.]|jgi:dihydroflavonol-4-reductase
MVLVTGASGLVGRHLIQALVQKGTPVTGLYRSAVPVFDGAEKANWIQADILDIVALEEAMQGIQQVYHCAAIVSFDSKNTKQLHQTNIEGTANVVNACLNQGIEKLLFVSSVAALGRIRENEAINETMNWTEETSNSAYGKSKYLAEMEVWRGIGEGLNAVIVNPVIILGSGDWLKGSSAIFKSAYDEFPWYTEGKSGFVDVLDVVKAMVLLMESTINAQRFIISAANIGYREIFTLIAHAFHKKPPHKKVTKLIAEIVWRLEAVKSWFTKKTPLLTKETAKTARANVSFNNTKLLEQLPGFSYQPLSNSIERICKELKVMHQLT